MPRQVNDLCTTMFEQERLFWSSTLYTKLQCLTRRPLTKITVTCFCHRKSTFTSVITTLLKLWKCHCIQIICMYFTYEHFHSVRITAIIVSNTGLLVRFIWSQSRLNVVWGPGPDRLMGPPWQGLRGGNHSPLYQQIWQCPVRPSQGQTSNCEMPSKWGLSC